MMYTFSPAHQLLAQMLATAAGEIDQLKWLVNPPPPDDDPALPSPVADLLLSAIPYKEFFERPVKQRHLIYVVAVSGIAVKIGVTHDIATRFQSFYVNCPLPLEIALLLQAETREAALKIENAMHRHFFRLSLHGEWFLMRPDLAIDAIARYCRKHQFAVKAITPPTMKALRSRFRTAPPKIKRRHFPELPPPVPRDPEGNNIAGRKLSPEDVQVIRTRPSSVAAMARHYGVDPKTIRDVLNGKSYKSVT